MLSKHHWTPLTFIVWTKYEHYFKSALYGNRFPLLNTHMSTCDLHYYRKATMLTPLSSEGYRSVNLMRMMHHCCDLCCLLLNWNSLNLTGSHLVNLKDRHWVQSGFLLEVYAHTCCLCQVIPHQYHPLENTLYNVNAIQCDRWWKNKNHLRQVNKDSFVSPSLPVCLFLFHSHTFNRMIVGSTSCIMLTRVLNDFKWGRFTQDWGETC